MTDNNLSPHCRGWPEVRDATEGETRLLFTGKPVEDEPLYLQEEGYCGTCAFFHREPKCKGGICGFYPDKPQMKLDDGCEEYDTSKEYESYWLDKED